MKLLDVEDLRIDIGIGHGRSRDVVHAVRGVSMTIDRGEIVGLVGESGCGKSTLARALMGVVPATATSSGAVRLDGEDLLGRDRTDLADSVWGSRIGFIPQNPAGALNPVLRVGTQMTEHVRLHLGFDRDAARARAVELLASVGLPNPVRTLQRHPHELSGGMRQRVAIAMSLACDPDLLVADEPTTALDVTVQAQIVDLLAQLCVERDMAMVFVTHDVPLVHDLAHRIEVMYAGLIVERRAAAELPTRRSMPYTAALLDAVPTLTQPADRRLTTIAGAPPDLRIVEPGCAFAPRCDRSDDQCDARVPPLTEGADGGAAACWHPLTASGGGVAGDLRTPYTLSVEKVMAVQGLVVEHRIGRRHRLRAVDDVSFELRRGEILGLVGESGCGKSTLGRTLIGLHRPVAGTIRGVHTLADRALAEVQLIFQDAKASLNPRRRVSDLVAEPLAITGLVDRVQRRVVAARLLESVGLDPAAVGSRRPWQLSGGQAQRVAIARALATEPRVLVCDEPVSALDVSVQAQVINLLLDIRNRTDVTMVFIAHDLAAVRSISDRVAVMYLGVICEVGPADDVFADPVHPYTRALVAAVPGSARRDGLPGEPGAHDSAPSGCRFRSRCTAAIDRCAVERPPLVEVAPGHHVACHVEAPVSVITRMEVLS